MALIVPPVNDLKRRALARPDGETTMFSTLVAVRDDAVLAAVSTPRMEATLASAHTVAIGLAPHLLAVAAQVRLPDGGGAIAYTTMTREHKAALAVQRYSVAGGEITFEIPERGEVEDRSIMDELARSMQHAPLDASRVATRDAATGAADGAGAGESGAVPDFIPLDEGRMAIDAGTCASVQRSINGIGGNVVYVARSPEHATRLLAHGMPQDVLLS
ncbi:hypothetical protein BH23ACT6_BH23ACT6_25410 [soil metagenome]